MKYRFSSDLPTQLAVCGSNLRFESCVNSRVTKIWNGWAERGLQFESCVNSRVTKTSDILGRVNLMFESCVNSRVTKTH